MRFSRPRLRTVAKLAMTGRRRARNRDEAAEQAVRLFRLMSTPENPADEQWLRDVTARAYDISDDPTGVMRQLATCKASSDRTAELSQVRVPTLVVHGDQDPLQSVRATAAAIPGARLRILPGVGHYTPLRPWPQILDELSEHHPHP